MKCLMKKPMVQSTGIDPGEMQEEPGLVSSDLAQHLRAPDVPALGRVIQKAQVKWPPARKQTEWCQFREDAARCLQAMTAIIVSFGAVRFDLEKEKTDITPYPMNHRALKIHQVR